MSIEALLEQLEDQLEDAERYDDIEQIRNNLRELYLDGDVPFALRKRAIRLAKDASIKLVQKGTSEYVKAAENVDAAKSRIGNSTEILERGRANLVIPAVAERLTDLVTALTEIEEALTSVTDPEEAEQDDVGSAKESLEEATNKMRSISDKVSSLSS